MTGAVPFSILHEGFLLLGTVAGPVIGALLITGLIVGVMQAATQVNDPAVGFVPRIAAALGICFLLGHWILERFGAFLAHCIEQMAGRGG